jgi:hypothetical protein
MVFPIIGGVVHFLCHSPREAMRSNHARVPKCPSSFGITALAFPVGTREEAGHAAP